MLLIVLALFWVAILIPIAIRHFREHGTERSIESFHAEHDVLSRQEYMVLPAHRLDMPDDDYEARSGARGRPRLTVVHADDTYRSLESRGSWDEWNEDYDYDHDRTASADAGARNRYATAYSSVPRERHVLAYEESYATHVSMKVRRTRIFVALLGAAGFFTLLSFVIGSSIVQDLAVLSWLGLVGFVAAALLAVSLGYLHQSSLPLRRSGSRDLATIEFLRPEIYAEDDSEFYEAESEGQWRRESSSHHAVG